MDMPAVNSVLLNDDKTTVRLDLAIRPELDVFRGHFEGVPIVPGVVQIHWALQFASRYFRPLSPLSIVQMEAIKFQHVMRPNMKTFLELELVKDRLLFLFSSETARFSSGRIVISM